mmetsp:Transcript_28033/g.41271  ORF Transcript_28033/g.41271 Transcript_28033/m.41271 type:complete len:107 (+) Transcript_28033:290-610(+)
MTQKQQLVEQRNVGGDPLTGDVRRVSEDLRLQRELFVVPPNAELRVLVAEIELGTYSWLLLPGIAWTWLRQAVIGVVAAKKRLVAFGSKTTTLQLAPVAKNFERCS